MSAERRAHPRRELIAQVELSHGAEVRLFRATNLSISGVYLEAAPDELAEIQRGALVSVAISVAEEEGAATPPAPIAINGTGKVIRKDARGFAVLLTNLAPEQVRRLHALIDDKHK